MSDAVELSGAVQFKTARMVCRRWLVSDRASIYAVYADPIGARWVDDGQPISPEECDVWLEVTARNYARRGYGMFTLVDRVSGATLGFAGLVHPDGQQDAEIKYSLAQAYWGLGYASEAIAGMLEYAVARHSLDRVIATVAPENVASQRALGKSGFVFVEVKPDEEGVQTQYYEWQVRK